MAQENPPEEVEGGGLCVALCSGGVDISLVRGFTHCGSRKGRLKRLDQVVGLLGMLRMVCPLFAQHFNRHAFEKCYGELVALRKRKAFVQYSSQCLNRKHKHKLPLHNPAPTKVRRDGAARGELSPLTDERFAELVACTRGVHDQRLKNFLTFAAYWEIANDDLLAALPFEFVLSVAEQLGEKEAEFVLRWVSLQDPVQERRAMLHVLSGHLRETNWWDSDERSEAHRQLDAMVAAAATTVTLEPFRNESSSCEFGAAREGSSLSHMLLLRNPSSSAVEVQLNVEKSFDREGFGLLIDGDTVQSFTVAPNSTQSVRVHAVAETGDARSTLECHERINVKFKTQGKRFEAHLKVEVNLMVVGRKHAFWLQDLCMS